MRRRPARVAGPIFRVGLVSMTAMAALVVPDLSSDARAAVNGCHATMTGTFLQPSWPVASWSPARWAYEVNDMNGVGIRSVILQWTVDMDANLAYYQDPPTWYPRGADMVGNLLSTAAPRST